MSSSSRRRKQDALQKLEDYEVKDEGDIYQVVDESEYRELVESRRHQRGDFVVDDGKKCSVDDEAL